MLPVNLAMIQLLPGGQEILGCAGSKQVLMPRPDDIAADEGEVTATMQTARGVAKWQSGRL